MHYLSLAEILELHEMVLAVAGGARGIRDLPALESAVRQPYATFGQHELYSDLASKAAVLCFSLIMNHPFVDGNKRAGHAAMETFLMLNGFEVVCDPDEQERVILDLAAGRLDKEAFTTWLEGHIRERSADS